MREPLGNWRATIARRSLQAMTGIFLISGMFCHAQQDCAPTNHFLLSDYAGQTMFDSPMVEINPVNWYSDHQYTVSITTLKSLGDQTNLPNWGPPTIPGCSYMNVLLYTWPKYADTYNVGPIDTKVTVSNTTYVNPWLTTFTVDVGSVDPAEEDQLVIAIPNGWWRYYVPILIQPPPPPTPPSPPPTPPCPTPTMATIDPSTWIAGQTYPITIMGTGYTTPANATSNCLATQITVGVNAGSLTLSDVTVVDSTKITATVAPADADPDETATINMYGGPPNESDDVAMAPGNARAMVGNAAPAANANNTSPPPSGAPLVATANAQIIKTKLTITQLKYTNSQSVWQDDPNTTPIAMPKTVWPSSSSPSVSVFVSGDKIKATASFNVSPSLPVAITGARIEGSVAGLGLLVATGVNIPAGATSLPSVNLTGDTAFPSSTTQHYQPLGVTWSFSMNGQPCSSNPSQCSAAGATSSEVYVTLSSPSGLSESVMPLTAVKLAIGSGGATTQTAAFQNTWEQFAGPANVDGWDGRPLYYYEQGVGFNGCAINTVDLLTRPTGSGQCGSWAHLLMDALAVNGIQSSFVTVTPMAGTWMLINNWTFNKGSYPTNPQYKWNLTLGIENGACCGMVPLPAGSVFGDLTSDPGLPGQNSPTPSEKAFNLHFIVKVGKISGIGGPYFDPSYGATYTGNCDFERQAVAGYGNRNLSKPSNFLYVRKPFNGCSVTLVP
jgi:hypothetical protein